MRPLIPLLLTALLCGCLPPTSYQDAISFRQLNKQNYRIQATGNNYTSTKSVSDYTLRKAAELCLENGFSYFLITSRNDLSGLTSGVFYPGREIDVILLSVEDAEEYIRAESCWRTKRQLEQ